MSVRSSPKVSTATTGLIQKYRRIGANRDKLTEPNSEWKLKKIEERKQQPVKPRSPKEKHIVAKNPINRDTCYAPSIDRLMYSPDCTPWVLNKEGD
jgi:hypothetical protein